MMPADQATDPKTLVTPTRTWLERLWATIGYKASANEIGSIATSSLLERGQILGEALLSERGEASGAAIAHELHAVLSAMDAQERLALARFLALHFVPDPVKLRAEAEAYLADPSPEQASRLANAAEPPRQELLRRMNMAPGATAALVALRKDLLGVLRDHPELKMLDNDLKHLFTSWFNRGFLELRRIDWQTPAAVLEKLIAYEAVHEFQGWEDLRRRLAPDRRCFGFFHPALPDEPLIFVQIALVKGIAAAIQPLLAADGDERAARSRAAQADTAIFYSISNCQDGLRGISFGNLLIKQVVEELKAELPGLKQFSTLSPVPGFRRWLDQRLTTAEPPADLLYPEERGALFTLAGLTEGPDTDAAALQRLLQTDGWWNINEVGAVLRGPLLRACAIYLTETTEQRGRPDPVARFHLGNGARLEHVNWTANVAPRGLRESYGLMVNYLYDPSTIEANHESFVQGGIVARSADVEALMAPPSPADDRKHARTRNRALITNKD